MTAITLPPLPASLLDVEAEVRAYAREAVALNSRWQPISTAPTDGTAVLVLIPRSDIAYAARFMDCWRMVWDHHQLKGLDAPRCWMPLPTALEES